MGIAEVDIRAFSPEQHSEKDLAVALLVHRMLNLPKESLADLISLAPEISQCQNREELEEMVQTIREILFPELLGDLILGSAGEKAVSERLQKRKERIGRQIQKQRAEKGYTQAMLAAESGLPQSHISRLESGQHSPSYKTLLKLSEVLGIDFDALDEIHEPDSQER